MFEQIFKNIDDVLWKEAGCSSELDYTEQTLKMLKQEGMIWMERGKRYNLFRMDCLGPFQDGGELLRPGDDRTEHRLLNTATVPSR